MSSPIAASTVEHSNHPFAELRQRVAGQVILPGDTEYAELRQLNHFRPANFPSAIVLPSNEADVSEAVRFARRRGMPISVRGGGHSIAGHSDMGEFIIDLSQCAGWPSIRSGR